MRLFSDTKRKAFIEGIKDSIPIGLGYFAVSFPLGIIARNAGLCPTQGFLSGILNHASAGEYALFTSVQHTATYLEVMILTLVINARYMLMSCSMSQMLRPKTPFLHRILLGFGITDEIFGITVRRGGYIMPYYNYGAMFFAIPLWGLGILCGTLAGNSLPESVVNAMAVALYGMFIAIIFPPAKKDKTIATLIIVSFALSFLCSIAPFVKELTDGTRTIILTVVIAAVAAIIKPIKEETK